MKGKRIRNYLLFGIITLAVLSGGTVMAVDTTVQEYSDAVTEEGYAQVMFDQGMNLLQQERVNEAIQFFIDAVTTKSNFTKAWYWLARTYQDQNMIEEAAWAWKKVLALDPQNAQAKYFSSKMENWKKYGKDAWDTYEKGQIAYQQGDFSKAISSFKQAISLNASLAPGYYWLGIARLKAGDSTGAISALEKYLTLAPGDKTAQYWLSQAKKAK